MKMLKRVASDSVAIWPWGTVGIGLVLMLLAITYWMSSTAWSQSHDHKIVKSEDLKWEQAPSLPKGAAVAVIEGPLNQAVPFTFRIKLPANFKIPPHWHPAVERVTVLTGTLHMGRGDKFDETKTVAMDPGSVSIIQPKTTHFVWTDKETVIQLHGTGPWDIVYANPEDDPRKK